MALCVLFDLCLMAGCILIDVIPYPNFVSTYFQIGIVFIAVFFTMPLRLEIPMLTLIEVAYIVAIIAWKTPRMASVDGYESVIGYICSILIAVIVSDLRVKEGLTKYRYMRQGTTDVLTSVRNRAECEKLIRDFLHKRGNDTALCAVLMLDMDNFKQINDCLGHQMGDHVLEQVGDILKKEFRSEDVIGRIGGDEFLILVKNIHDRENVLKVAERVTCSVRQLSEMLDGVSVSCSCGAVVFEGMAEYEELYKMADESMYEAKRSGGGRCVVQVVRAQA
jgi:diguanylate cyclase (GGDEF)-like protein